MTQPSPATAKLPEIPELLKEWGMRGKLLHTQLTQSLSGAEMSLATMVDYEKGDRALDEFIAETENDLTERYAKIAADNEAAAEADKAKRQAEIDAITAKYEEAAKEREAALESLREEIKSESGLEMISDDDNAEAVAIWDMVRDSIDSQRKMALDTLSNKNVPNPDYDPSQETTETSNKETLTIQDVIGNVKLPDIGIGKKTRGSKSGATGETAWRPRWAKAVINGEVQSDPTVQGVADTLGVQRDNLLKAFQRSYSRAVFDPAENGAEFTFTVGPIEKDGQTNTYNVTITKGTAPKAQ